jgi:hypothetical protein
MMAIAQLTSCEPSSRHTPSTQGATRRDVSDVSHAGADSDLFPGLSAIDGVADAVVLVTKRQTGKLGVAFLLGGTRRVEIVGAGNPAMNGADDLSWIDRWDV